MTGRDYLDSIRDGRRVYVGGELVEDVTIHPAFRNAARSFVEIYDRKRAPENRDVMTCEEDGEVFSTYFLLPRTRPVGEGAHEIAQAGMGPARFRFRRTAHAIRKILLRTDLRDE